MYFFLHCDTIYPHTTGSVHIQIQVGWIWFYYSLKCFVFFITSSIFCEIGSSKKIFWSKGNKTINKWKLLGKSDIWPDIREICSQTYIVIVRTERRSRLTNTKCSNVPWLEMNSELIGDSHCWLKRKSWSVVYQERRSRSSQGVTDIPPPNWIPE